ncbi:MAG: hypothetical protein ACRCSF_08470 [Mycobacteriaceae bacterium]
MLSKVLVRVCDLSAHLGGTINVANEIMPLSAPEVGRKVAESRVDTGKATQHPVKRARTTAISGADLDHYDYAL